MRPLVRPALPPQLQHVPAARLLVSAFGNFCSFCERPLLDSLWVWNAKTGQSQEGDRCTSEDWEHLYLLDHNCHEAQRHASPLDLPLLLLPTDTAAFLQEGPPLLYILTSMSRDQVNEEQKLIQSDNVDQVLISASDYRAQATIRYFALNTAYLVKDRLVVPRQDHLSLLDRRMEQRSEAWREATQAALDLREAGQSEVVKALTRQLRQLIGTTGFWSTCRAAVDLVLQDPQKLQEIFAANLPADRPVIAGLAAKHAIHFLGNGPHQPFPGTAPF
ncbi:hypothetical protein [Pseudomonas rubra]|uniref:Uncharacterized protein n=1 Tax=Pseudomonas rubra TaxID=2942627 RepID=A0ABT5PBQ8_9PSED|nr:hypothetical protein [Pseudomonas rubra]MDD1015606.1 hypothetical protein [Pseudomonas rubra]MDD1040957.1 hypothetical protein [Pseudomonas rubra]MDD1154806.1 hypothetical protein [Pseudomonas rubra]